MSRPAVFLDRDGTINEEVGYLSDPEKVVLIPGAAEALIRLKAAGFKLIVLTNQSGVARGYFTARELAEVNMRLDSMLAEKGAAVDAYYYCPHHPKHGEMVDCDCRKPKTGMVDTAAREHGIDLARSYFVGDKRTDVQLGKNAGGKSILVLTGFGRDEVLLLEDEGLEADVVLDGLPEAADWIIENSKKS
jgi:D-glycero-D-manno-heptose 1,7-bisphosphate phosphatase